ncbi:hypothetical protein MRX96_039673 [Rhipicephalus microplus]
MKTGSWCSVSQSTFRNCWHKSGLSPVRDANEQEEHDEVSEQEEEHGAVIDFGMWTEASAMPPPRVPASWPVNGESWSHLHADFAGPVDGHMVLVIVDLETQWSSRTRKQPERYGF